MRARAVSFDFGQVLGGLDWDELARRLLVGDASGEDGQPVDEVVRRPLALSLEAMLPAAARAHDVAVAEGRGHEAAWRGYVRVLIERAAAEGVATGGPIDAVVDALWRAQPTRNLWRAVPDEARALLRDLRAAGVPLALSTNSEGRARELMVEIGLGDAFGAILDSGVLGVAKPDPRFFALATRALGVEPAALVHVGDSESADVDGALAVGAIAVRFDRFVPGASARPTRAAYRCDDFPSLRRVLRDLLGASI